MRPAQDLIVIYDELDLPLGTIQDPGARFAGGPQRSPQSINGALGTEEWLRLRIGVGLPDEAWQTASAAGGKDYLLSPMRKADLAVLDEVLDRVADGRAAHHQ